MNNIQPKNNVLPVFHLFYTTFIWYKIYTRQARVCLYVGTDRQLFILYQKLMIAESKFT